MKRFTVLAIGLMLVAQGARASDIPSVSLPPGLARVERDERDPRAPGQPPGREQRVAVHARDDLEPAPEFEDRQPPPLKTPDAAAGGLEPQRLMIEA